MEVLLSLKNRFLLLPSLFITLIFLAVAVFYQWRYEWFVRFAREFYGSTDYYRYPYLIAKVTGYKTFFWMLAGALIFWCVALRMDDFIKKIESGILKRLPPVLPKVFMWIAFFALIPVALWFSDREWMRYNHPCWDNYCVYSELIFNWFRQPGSETWNQLLAFMRSDYHSNSPFVPLLVACTKLITGITVITSYRLLCCAAMLAGLFIIFRFLVMQTRCSVNSAAMLLFLIITNMVVIRSFSFPQTDAFVFLWTILSITQSYEYVIKPAWTRLFICFTLLTAGLFIKLSFLPVLIFIPLWTMLYTGIGNKELFIKALRTALGRSLVFGAGPLLIYLVFQWSLGLLKLYAEELSMMQTEDNYFPFHLICLIHAGAIFFPLIILGAKKLTKTDIMLLTWTGVYLLSLWLGKTSGWDRFYISVIPFLAIAGRHGIVILKENTPAALPWIGVGLYAFINYSAILLNLYQ